MADDLVSCPSCGIDTPEGRFCKFCGEPLPEIKKPPVNDLTENDVVDFESDLDEAVSEVEQISYPSFGFVIDSMDDKSSAILFSQAELGVLNNELDGIIEKTRATRQALELEHADKEILATRALELKDQFENTKSRRDELTQVLGDLPLKRTFNELELQEGKLAKLEEIEKTLDSTVYEEERTKILIKLKTLRKDLKSELKTSKQWNKGMNKKLKELRRELSRLDAKLKIGDISRTAFDTQKQEIDRCIRIIELGKISLEPMLEAASKK
ncbi:MAG: hypothetical protein ACTSQZ_04125 [Candidatus Thorarchaeota archaeon]